MTHKRGRTMKERDELVARVRRRTARARQLKAERIARTRELARIGEENADIEREPEPDVRPWSDLYGDRR